MERLFVNFGYAFMLVGITIKDILWLRIVLIFGHGFIWLYAFTTGNNPVVFWNTLFIIINGFRIINLWRERRPYQIPEHLADLYDTIFHAMSRKEFLDFWSLSRPAEYSGETIIKDGEPIGSLSLVFAGKVLVKKGNRILAQLERGKFLGEMGYLTGDAASADVVADGIVVLHSWSFHTLTKLKRDKPELLIKLQNIIGMDLSRKIRKSFDQ